ncbi:enoyl-CoA-hydratase DpgB [Polymorphospora rubra]|uniref:enoyl-CoA-hydratase DpgB n=1 Tax=Polymorphospora rubra TaxID=338584 RepID=UPI001BB3A474|nr:enoyl-CoA-hydratase DpgB [Polymorphospora rubra]
MGSTDDPVLVIDGSRPVSPGDIDAVHRICDQAEDGHHAGLLTVYVSGAPEPGWTAGLNVGLVTKWERAVRRLERSALVTVAVATGDCGGTALDVLLATDVRIVAPGARLMMATDCEATWPGMALYRLIRHGIGSGVRRAVLLGAPIDAGEAVAVGLVDVVTDEPGSVLAQVAAAAGGVAGKELAIRRQLMLEAAGREFDEALGSHLAACDRALRRAGAA